MDSNINLQIVGNNPSGTEGCLYASYLLGQNFTVYKINVQYQGHNIITEKRYSEFASFEKQLRDLELIVGNFPTKSFRGKLGDKNAVAQRQHELETFLQQVVDQDSSTCHHLLLDFLNLNSITENFTPPILVPSISVEKIAAANTTGAGNMAPVIKFDNNLNINILGKLQHALVEGVMIRKHCRKSKPKSRLIFVNEDFSNLCWAQQKQLKPTSSSIALSDITEVRKGNEEDPRKADHVGTAVLRKHSTTESIIRSFSLITHERSLDIEALDSETYELLYNGFKELVERNGQFTALSAEKRIPSLVENIIETQYSLAD